MVSRLILIAAFLVSAAPPQRADYQRCVTIHNEPLIDHPRLNGNAAPVSDLASWK